MAKVHCNLGNQKCIMEFLPDHQLKIIQLENKNKYITVHYSAETKVIDLIHCIKSLDFSGCKHVKIKLLRGKGCHISQAENGGMK